MTTIESHEGHVTDQMLRLEMRWTHQDYFYAQNCVQSDDGKGVINFLNDIVHKLGWFWFGIVPSVTSFLFFWSFVVADQILGVRWDLSVLLCFLSFPRWEVGRYWVALPDWQGTRPQEHPNV